MPAVRVTRTTPPRRRSRHPKMVLVSETGRRITIPYAPVEVDHDGEAPIWVELDRALREPTLEYAGMPLQRRQFDLAIVRDGHTSVEDILNQLRQVTRRRERVTISSMGISLGGVWRVTDLTYKSTRRQPGTNAIVRAVAGVEIKRAADAELAVGPVSGGVSTAAADAPDTAKPNRYTVKPGDTLWAIAQNTYGDGARWSVIADANGIRDPRRLTVGQTLTLPAA
jgi:nucleoid-associated protein YgaU